MSSLGALGIIINQYFGYDKSCYEYLQDLAWISTWYFTSILNMNGSELRKPQTSIILSKVYIFLGFLVLSWVSLTSDHAPDCSIDSSPKSPSCSRLEVLLRCLFRPITWNPLRLTGQRVWWEPPPSPSDCTTAPQRPYIIETMHSYTLPI